MISSVNLFSFTTKYDVLKNILKSGFRYSKWTETLPKSNYKQENYIVCFCDIPWKLNEEHRSCYGNNGLVMSKEWAVKNGISPVRYINPTSVGMSEEYIQRKTFHRENLEVNHFKAEEVLVGDLITENFIVNGYLKGVISLKNKMQNDQTFRDKYQKEIKCFEKMEEAIVAAGMQDFYEKLKGCIYSHLETLYNELEFRDSYERNYKEDFKHHATGVHPGKILYNEREWRSVKYLDKKSLKAGDAPDFLPAEQNLKFEDKDVVAVLVEKKELVDEIKHLVQSGETKLDSSSDKKVFFVDDYKE